MPRGITPERAPALAGRREVVQVAVAELDLRFAELRLVNPKREARLRASIERDGFRSPVLVSTGVEPGRRVLLDGVKRLKVARALGIATKRNRSDLRNLSSCIKNLGFLGPT